MIDETRWLEDNLDNLKTNYRGKYIAFTLEHGIFAAADSLTALWTDVDARGLRDKCYIHYQPFFPAHGFDADFNDDKLELLEWRKAAKALGRVNTPADLYTVAAGITDRKAEFDAAVILNEDSAWAVWLNAVDLGDFDDGDESKPATSPTLEQQNRIDVEHVRFREWWIHSQFFQ